MCLLMSSSQYQAKAKIYYILYHSQVPAPYVVKTDDKNVINIQNLIIKFFTTGKMSYNKRAVACDL